MELLIHTTYTQDCFCSKSKLSIITNTPFSTLFYEKNVTALLSRMAVKTHSPPDGGVIISECGRVKNFRRQLWILSPFHLACRDRRVLGCLLISAVGVLFARFRNLNLISNEMQTVIKGERILTDSLPCWWMSNT